ncbi:hypothetical protein BKA57DRAFT_506065 [Linnemannia elongata]|nr:hypothetical protein BKA57DRAFT_506065 [Linnemannia elongata]
MLRRDPTRIELRAEDLLDFDRAREEYLDATGANNTSNKNKHKATTAVPPPTPANQTTTTAGRKPDPFELAEREPMASTRSFAQGQHHGDSPCLASSLGSDP